MDLQTPTPAGRMAATSTSRMLDRDIDLSASALTSTLTTARKRPLPADSHPADLSTSILRRSALKESFAASMSARAHERQLQEANDRTRAAEAAMDEARARIERLERDRAWLEEREKEARSTMESEARERERERAEGEGEVRRLRKENAEMRLEVVELREAVARDKARRDREEAAWKGEKEMRARAQRELEEELAGAMRRERERAREVAGLREEVESLEEELANTTSSRPSDDVTLIRDELHRQSTNLRTLESANTRLTQDVAMWKERANGAEVLREEKRDLERRAVDVERLRDEVGRLRGELDAARREKEQWTAFLSSTSPDPTSSTPTAITSSLSKLRHDYAALTSEHLAQTTRLQQAEAALAVAEARAEEAETRVGEVEARAKDAEGRASREKRMASVREREVQGLKALVDTYTTEAETDTSTFDKLSAERIAQLEEVVDELKRVNAELAEEMEHRGPAVGGGGGGSAEEARRQAREERERRERAEQDLQRLEAALEKTSDDKETLEQKLFDLTHSIASGAHVPPRERVLQLASNPVSDHFAVRAQQLDDLRAERDALLDRGGEMVPRESWEQVRKEKEELVEEARAREKRMLRLKQVFAAKATEFREAVTSILGYKLNFSGNGRVRLTSIYDPSTALVFQSSEGNVGSMRLIGVGEREDERMGEAEGISGGLQFWVRERGAIPCFLAQLTMEAFDRTTVGRSAGWKVDGAADGEEGGT